MNELIKVTIKNNQQLVSARELHNSLNLTTRFSKWVNQNFRHFQEGIDFTSVTAVTVVNNGAKRDIQDYALTLDMAKHIAMMAGTDKGFEVRDYFIQVEKAWNSPEMVMKRALNYANDRVKKLEFENAELKLKADYYDEYMNSENLITTTMIAERYGWGPAKLNRKLHEMGVIYKKGDLWHLYVKYKYQDYAKYFTYANSGSKTLKWTPKGEKLIYELLLDQGIEPISKRTKITSQLELEPQPMPINYCEVLYSATDIANENGLYGKAYLIGSLAGRYGLRPTYSLENQYCKTITDRYGNERLVYKELGRIELHNILLRNGYIHQ